MRIDKISQIFGVDLQRSAGSVKNTEKSEKSSKSDSVQFSKQAKDLQANSDAKTVSARMDVIPDIRPEKVQEAKEKISSGYFDSEEFMDHLADRLLKEFGVQPPA